MNPAADPREFRSLNLITRSAHRLLSWRRYNGRRFLAGIITLILVVWTFASRASNGSDISARFDAANKLYEQGKYSAAASQYESILHEQIASPAIFFNLGNALYKTGQLGRAIAAYCQAEQLAPRDPDLRANLQFVRNQIEGPTFTPDRWQAWLAKLTLNEWSWLAMIALWTWFTLLILFQWRPGLRSAMRSCLHITGIGAVGVFLCAGTLAYTRYTERKAIITAGEAIARNGPLDESPTAFTVHDGAELKVLDEKNQWLQVSTGTARSGWVRRNQVTILPGV